MLSNASFLVLFLMLFLALFHYIVYFLHTRKNVPYWASALGMVLLIPLAIFALYMPIGLRLINLPNPTATHEQADLGASFVLFVLLIQAAGFFLYGVFKHSYSVWKRQHNEQSTK